METLYNYISYINKKYDLTIIDCHTHMFGKGKILTYPHECPINGKISMVENSIAHPDRSLFDDFKSYINFGEVTDKNKLLCVGKDTEETIKIYNTFKSKISGFGEIKCYKRGVNRRGDIIEIYDTSILQAVINRDLPVFIHWDLDGKHDEELYEIIKSNPNTKFVLCHADIGELTNPDKSFKTATSYQSKLTNLWLSISWVALDYFIKDDFQSATNKLSMITIPDHVLVGTDFNPEMNNKNISFEDRYRKFLSIYKQFNVPVVLNNLFR